MEILRAYSKSEDAWLAATLLQSRGIDAIVIDDNAIGGNLFGVQKSAIRIEVPVDELDEARAILEEVADEEE